MAIYKKTPAEVLDYVIDWTAWLAGDTITASAWTVPAGLTLDSDSNTTEIATAWISGGTAGGEYRITNKITTANVPARIAERTMVIRVKADREA